MMRWVWTTKSCKCDSVCQCVITLCVAVWSQCVRRNRGDCARKDLWLPQQSIGRWGQVCVNANVLLFVTILPHVLIRSFFLVFARFFSWKSFNIFPFFSANVPNRDALKKFSKSWDFVPTSVTPPRTLGFPKRKKCKFCIWEPLPYCDKIPTKSLFSMVVVLVLKSWDWVRPPPDW